jgi:hypothetical protein
VAGHSTFDGDYGALGMGLADGDEAALELGYLWQEDDSFDDSFDDGQIAILSEDADADALAYMYDSALDAPQPGAWLDGDAGAFGGGAAGWARRMNITFQVIGLVVLLGISAVTAYTLASSVLPSSPVQLQTSSVDTTPKKDEYVISPPEIAGSPTPAEVASSVGVWVDTSVPPTTGAEHVFARVTRNGEAIASVPVQLDAEFPSSTATFGPVMTDSYGVAAFTLSFSGLPSFRPVYLTATAKLPDGSTVTGQTFFVPR